MNLYVGCTSGIGKSTLAKKNDIFVDFDCTIPYRGIILDKKKEFVENLLSINNKIILFNVKPKYKKRSDFMFNDEIKQYIETAKNYFFLKKEFFDFNINKTWWYSYYSRSTYYRLKKKYMNQFLELFYA